MDSVLASRSTGSATGCVARHVHKLPNQAFGQSALILRTFEGRPVWRLTDAQLISALRALEGDEEVDGEGDAAQLHHAWVAE